MKLFSNWIVLFLVSAGPEVYAQSPDKPFITLRSPLKETSTVFSKRQYITGLTCKTCTLTINDKDVTVYNTGAFAFAADLEEGENIFRIIARSDRKISKTIKYILQRPFPDSTVTTTSINKIESLPAGNLVLIPGDEIGFRVKALPGRIVTTYNNTRLYEMASNNNIAGIYQGTYIIKAGDTFRNKRFPVMLMTPTGEQAIDSTFFSFSVVSDSFPSFVKTQGRLAHLEYGLGDDRLGGAKIGYLDSNIILKVTGKIGKDYRVRLSGEQTAYIEDDQVTVMPPGTLEPRSFTGNYHLSGDSTHDYLQINLSERLPYQSRQLLEPSRITLDIFGAVNNTNWIRQFNSAKEIISVDYEQLRDDVVRITVQLKHKQHWGHSIYYKGNTLVLKVKQQPETDLSKLTIAVDAGHGGTNKGGIGITGVYEKEIALAVSKKLQRSLEKEGAKVIMTRNEEIFFDNKERILFYRDSVPDLLISIHLNSSGDPVGVSGTSTFYRYIGFKPLSNFIYHRMLELGLKEDANTGSFNFMLNSPTEYPNVLVEMLYLSNPADEEKILDENFQQSVADKIILGIKDFLRSSKY